MSHYTSCQLEIRDEAALLAALAEVGYPTVDVHRDAQPLFGYLGDARPERAHVIIRRQYVGGCANDIGFIRGADGRFEAIISDFDKRRHPAAWLTQLTTLVGVHKTLAEAHRRGYRTERRVDDRGRQQVVVSGRF